MYDGFLLKSNPKLITFGICNQTSEIIKMQELLSLTSQREKRGFVLLVVLLLTALCTILVVGFLIVVSNDFATSKAYSSGERSHQLADSTVQLVMGQIQQATSSTANVGWASQPGMIRTYDNSGNPQTNYKLYSSGAMTTSGALTVPAAASTSGGNVNDFDPAWFSNTALWTDLNSPVTDDTGTLNYPIIDGNNLSTSSGVSTYQAPAQTIQGFSINSPPLAKQGTINPVPMPVQWLYQLKDGSIVAGTSNGTNTVNVTNASTTNPIVARIAFWTDDETSKININTACGDEWTTTSSPTVTTSVPNQPGFGSSAPYVPPGAFWDIPRCYTSYDFYNLALNQPAQNEFQRYPGHPATVYLSAVFPNLTRDQIFSLVPRINGGGSEGGTVLAAQAVVPDSDRLYGSVDELLFAATKPSTLRTLNDTSTNILNKATMKQATFFVTANSRAPEVNVFGQPRIAIWPIDSDVIAQEATGNLSPRGTAFDALMAFCSHLGPLGSGNDYCVQRQAGGYMSQTADLSIARNASLYSYLQGLMGAPLPGFGGTLASKFGADTNQIATEIFDYIRCTNPSDDNIAFKTVDGSGNPTNDANCYTPNCTYTTNIFTGGYWSGNFLMPKSNHAFIVPGQIGTTQGFGRSVTISEMGLSFICCGSEPTTGISGDGGTTATNSGTTYYSNFPPLTGTMPPTVAQIAANAFFSPTPGPPPSGYATPTSPGFIQANWNYNLPTYNWASDTTGKHWTGLQPGQSRVKAVFLLNPYTVSPGYGTMHLDLGIEVSGLDGLNLQGYLTGTGSPTPGISNIPMEFPHDGTVVLSSLTLRTPTWGLSTEFFLNAFFAPLLNLPENSTIPSPQVGDTPATFNGKTTNQGPSYRIYPFVSAPITVSSNSYMVLTGGNNVTVKLWHLSSADETGLSAGFTPPATQTTPTATSTLIQTISVNLAPLTGFKVPTVCTDPTVYNYGNNVYANNPLPPCLWDFTQNGVFGNSNPSGRFYDCQGQSGHEADFIYNSYDSIRTLVPGYPTDKTGVAGDYRMLAALGVVPPTVFVAHRLITDSPTSQYCYSFSALCPNCRAFQAWAPPNQDAGPSPQPTSCTFGSLVTSTPPQAKLAASVNNLIPVQTGDFDNGCGSDMDGPYINKPDTGFSFNTAMSGIYPYFDRYADNTITTFYSPNRQVSSPGRFGSLPVGVQRGLPWTTLLFRPQPTHPDGVPVPDVGALSSGAPYGAQVADHMIMDFFWMPVVEPYAISEPFSTAGKINLNYQIAPFTYIIRETAIDALLKSQRVLAIPNTAVSTQYKNPYGYPAGGNGGWPSADYRSDLNLSDTNGTLRQFKEKFAAGDLFRSASQICDIYLTPSNQAWTKNVSATTFWTNNQLTGDNARETPYANLYGCLTTKSNTYTVHFRVQALQKIPSTPANQWVDGSDVVNSDYRGSTLIERYVDSSSSTLPDFTKPFNAANTLGPSYKFRVLSTRKFAP